MWTHLNILFTSANETIKLKIHHSHNPLPRPLPPCVTDEVVEK